MTEQQTSFIILGLFLIFLVVFYFKGKGEFKKPVSNFYAVLTGFYRPRATKTEVFYWLLNGAVLQKPTYLWDWYEMHPFPEKVGRLAHKNDVEPVLRKISLLKPDNGFDIHPSVCAQIERIMRWER